MIARLLTVAALCLPLWAGAHDFWVNPDRFVVAVGASTALRMQVGHGDARRTSPIPSRRILRFAAWTPGGDVIDLRGDGKLAPAEAGLHLLALETDANAQSHLPAGRFNAYVKDEGLWPAAAERDKRGTKGQDAIERYRRVAKALVQAGEPGEGSQDLATKRVGLPLEIVLARPLSDPDGGDTLAAQVLFQGRPLARALVKLTDLDHDAQPAAARTTDGAGRVVFRRPPPGHWLLNVVWTTPLSGDDGIDFDTVFSSLSFAVPP
ncbi:DUF4198 domain-containing protein [Massilia rhizosphaerae]|uniref:DUF4198 domain-containing protein n=1 Tax=Massilia rhizosphaerae TaxID=2784389 RepID=UPI0018DB8D42|nr:DUF4198 domain-containing protein [Massilia rhizosphaerae]